MKLTRLLEFDDVKKSFTKAQSVTIDTVVYRMHYRATSLALLGCCLLVTARQFFGHPIDCVVKVPDDDEETHHMERVINRYCWIHTTFSVNSAWQKPVGDEVPYPGIDKRTPTEEVTYHAYYQWVWIVLLIQAVCFYFPHFMWKNGENRLIAKLVPGLKGPGLEEKERRARIADLGDFLYRSTSQHTARFMGYVLTEVLNFANVIAQLLFVDYFLGGKFSDYGCKVLGWKAWSDFPLQYDPMMEVFPRMTKCTFHQFGPTGDIQRYDTACVLPINIINEKVFLFLWFWFYLLLVVTGLSLIYRLFCIFCPCLRTYALMSNGKCYKQKRDLEQVLRAGGIGDFFLLLLIAKNIDKKNFRDLLTDLKTKLKDKVKVL